MSVFAVQIIRVSWFKTRSEVERSGPCSVYFRCLPDRAGVLEPLAAVGACRGGAAALVLVPLCWSRELTHSQHFTYTCFI